MQFLSIKKSTTLSELAETVGERNVDQILSANSLDRTPKIGQSFYSKCESVNNESNEVTWQRKASLLNNLTECSDVFETASLMSSDGWKTLSALGTLPGTLKIPETLTLKDSVDVLGNSEPISDTIYNKAMAGLESPSHSIDPSIFNEFSSRRGSTILDSSSGYSTSNPFEGFHLPWGEVTLYSSLANESIDIPVYPEEVSDSVKANYTTMPDIIYQYEPWQVFESSGPRANSYTFKFHRDMWSGDHSDGKANQLIRFCEACCYPEYNGSAVNTSTVTLYVKGRQVISGIMTSVETDWSGPIGNDGWYLYCEMTLSITEVSKTTLDYSTVKNKNLIG